MCNFVALFFSVKMLKKSWYKGNNGNLLTIEPSVAALNSRRGRSVPSGCGCWSWINGGGIQGLTRCCRGLVASGMLQFWSHKNFCSINLGNSIALPYAEELYPAWKNLIKHREKYGF